MLKTYGIMGVGLELSPPAGGSAGEWKGLKLKGKSNTPEEVFSFMT